MLPFLFHFPTRCTILLKVRTQIAFGGSFELARLEHKAHGLAKTVLHTCSDLFKPVHNCSQLFTLVNTCSHLFTLVHTCSYLFTPQWLSTLFAEWQFLIEFSPCKSCYFSILRPILLKLQNFAHLIESFPIVYGLCSCIKVKMSIPPAPHTYRSLMEKGSSAVIF